MAETDVRGCRIGAKSLSSASGARKYLAVGAEVEAAHSCRSRTGKPPTYAGVLVVTYIPDKRNLCRVMACFVQPLDSRARERLRDLVGSLKGGDTLAPVNVVVPSTYASLDLSLTADLAAVGLPLAVVNPRQIRDPDSIGATGRLAKTGRLDAQVLAHLAQAVQPTPPAAARRPDPGVGCSPGTAPAAGLDAHCRKEPPGHDSIASASASSCAYLLADPRTG